MVERYHADHKKRITDDEVLVEIDAGAKKAESVRNRGGIVVRGITDVSVHFSKCCNPLPGDEIVGYVTRGRGVSIHRTDCVNIMNMNEIDRKRLIEAEWQKSEGKSEQYLADIDIYAQNRTGLIVDISKVFSDLGIEIVSMNTRTSKQGVATISLSFNIHNTDELSGIMKRLHAVQSVVDIERTTG